MGGYAHAGLVELAAATAGNGEDLAGHMGSVDRDVDNGTSQGFELAAPLQRNRRTDFFGAPVVNP